MVVNTNRVCDIYIDNFDMGIAYTLGAEQIGPMYFLMIDKIPIKPNIMPISPPLYTEDHGIPSQVGQRMPGIPIIWKNPHDKFVRYVLPCIRISREDPPPALERWPSLHLKYKVPAPGAQPVTVTYGNREIQGYSKYEQQNGTFPFDIPYTITIETSGQSALQHALMVLRYAQKIFKPYSVLSLIDDEGNLRKYNMFVEGPNDLGNVADIADRTAIFALSVRVQGELDLSDPQILDKMVQKVAVKVERKEE